MIPALRLLCVLAHPDDESLGTGGILAKYAAEGVATYLETATRGERGWQGNPQDNPGPQALGHLREMELRAAAKVLRVRGLKILDCCDGALRHGGHTQIIGQIASYVRQIQPQVVVTFGPDGATGHPDHIAVAQCTTAALVCAADPAHEAASHWLPHRVAKLYYLADTHARIALYTSIFGDGAMTVDGVKRHVRGWEPWAVTTHINTSAYWHTVWEAVACHTSQLPNYDMLAQLSDEQHRALWGTQELYRVYSVANSVRDVEDDLFAGVR